MEDKWIRRVELQLYTAMTDGFSVVSPREALDTARALGIEAVAITDRNSVQSLIEAANYCSRYEESPKLICGVQVNIGKEVTLLAKNAQGLQAIYKLISSMEMREGVKRCDPALVEENRAHLLVGPGQESLYSAMEQGMPQEKLGQMAGFYDYLTLLPGRDPEQTRKIYALGKALGISPVAVGNCRYVAPEDSICRQILGMEQEAQPCWLRSAQQMLEAFDCLGADAYEAVVTNPGALAQQIEDLKPGSGDFPAFQLPQDRKIMEERCYQRLVAIYGGEPPVEIPQRLRQELSLLGDYAGQYLLAAELADFLRQRGGLNGTRGTIGSTLIAYLLGISDVDPLPAHYRCPHCGHTEFAPAVCGYDLPGQDCPCCAKAMEGHGMNIPFETCMSPTGDLEPRIDINIPPSLHKAAVEFLIARLGKERLALAGAIGILGSKIAQERVDAYCAEKGLEMDLQTHKRVVQLLSRVKQEDGKQAFGLVLLPEGMTWEQVTPVTRLDRPVAGVERVTHYEYYQIEPSLPKLNVLGYGVLDRLGQLFAQTHTTPDQICYNDPKVLDLFARGDTMGVPQFSTLFVWNLLAIPRPLQFSDLVAISAMAHGTCVWLENGEQLYRDHPFQQLISDRDHVFQTLRSYGLDSMTAYQAMTTVRKGRFGFDTPKNRALRQKLEKAGVPQWYLDSMAKIHYLFPRAHSANYTQQAFMAAWFKVYYPVEFYRVTLQDLGAEAYTSDTDQQLQERYERLLQEGNGLSRERDAVGLLLEVRQRGICL